MRPRSAARGVASPPVTAISKVELERATFVLEAAACLVADVAAIFAQVRGDAVGAGSIAISAARPGSGCVPPRALQDGGDVVDVHTESKLTRGSFGLRRRQ
ncbi:MAG: hypothetical protein AcusKO_07240 [Acuticoccus sp.]